MHSKTKNRQKIKLSNPQSAFTIVELLIVIVIIGILAAIVIVSYIGISKKATEASLTSDLDGAKRQLELYKTEHETYPTTMDANKCPTAPENDTKYCLKNKDFQYTTTDNGLTYTLKLTKSGITFEVTNNSTPKLAETAPTAPTLPESDWVTIGTQRWARKNLNIGTMINNTINQSDNSIIEKYCYNNQESNCETHGALYQFKETMQYNYEQSSRGLCPANSHVPSDDEWKKLEIQLGMTEENANIGYDSLGLRKIDQSTKTEIFGSSIFNMTYGGYASDDYAHGYYDIDGHSLFWSSWSLFPNNINSAWIREIIAGSNLVSRYEMGATKGLSVRCLADNEPVPEESFNQNNWITIGAQTWAKKNLNVGTIIAGTQDPTNNSTVEKFCYDDNESNCKIYGALYRWDEAMKYTANEGSQGICPSGSHIPTDNDWKILEMQIGMSQAQADLGETLRNTDGEGTKLKTNGSSGMNLPFAGYGTESGGVQYADSDIWVWSSTSKTSTTAWHRYMFTSSAGIVRGSIDKKLGMSIRCLRN